MIDAFIFSLAMLTTIGTDGRACEFPITYGLDLYEIATHHDIDPLEVGGYLCAEHRGRNWDPALEGRYNCSGASCEIGLGQLKSIWAKRAEVRCSFKRPYYQGLNECLTIQPGQRVVRTASPRQIRSGRYLDLRIARVNIEALVIAFAYVQMDFERGDNRRAGDYRAFLRCRRWTALNAQRRCLRKVQRYIDWESGIHDRVREINAAFEMRSEPHTQPSETRTAYD